jgi:MFS family permease
MLVKASPERSPWHQAILDVNVMGWCTNSASGHHGAYRASCYRSGNHTAAAAANILAALSAGLLTGCFAVGAAAERIGARKAFRLCYIPMLAILLLLLPISEAWIFSLIVFIMAFRNGGAATLVSPISTELFGMKSNGLILGVGNMMSTFGAALGPFIAGYIFDIDNSYQWAFLLCGVLVATALVLSTLLKPLLKRSYKANHGF